MASAIAPNPVRADVPPKSFRAPRAGRVAPSIQREPCGVYVCPLGCSQFAKLFVGQPSLFEDAPKCAGRNVARVHRHIGLPTVWMAKHDVGTGLAFDDETRALQF